MKHEKFTDEIAKALGEGPSPDYVFPNRPVMPTKDALFDDRELAGNQQNSLPLGDAPVDPIKGARKLLGVTADEERLVASLLAHTLTYALLAEYGAAVLTETTIAAERMLVDQHRAIVAKAVAAARLPSAASAP